MALTNRRNKLFGITGCILSITMLASIWHANDLSIFHNLNEILLFAVILLVGSIFTLFKKPRETNEPKKRVFNQKFVFLTSIFCVGFSSIGLVIKNSFFEGIFLFGLFLLVTLIVWKLFLIFKGKEEWGIY